LKAIILAAGMGSRLGMPNPKPLTKLETGEMIMERQVKMLQKFISIDDIFVVVGFKKDIIMEAFSDLTYVFNNVYDTTNTSKSLLRGLKKTQDDDVIWMNGDVVFDEEVLHRVIKNDGSCMAINSASVAEEEVKYNLFENGLIHEVSKTVENPLGEAVGVNKVVQHEIALFIDKLAQCDDDDYFERGLEFAIAEGMKVSPVDISDLLCIEIDFNEDLKNANEQLSNR